MTEDLSKVYFIKNYNPDVLSWSDVFEAMDDGWNNDEDRKHMIHRGIGFFVIHNGRRLKQLKPMLEDLACRHAHIYVNLVANDRDFGRHADGMDVWVWQCIGVSHWFVEERGENDVDKYILEPGDMIYVPRGIPHIAIPQTPRASVTFSRN